MTALIKLAVSAALLSGVSACSASVEQSEKVAKATHAHTHSQADATSKTKTSKTIAPYETVKPGANVTLNSVLPKSMTSGTYQSVQLQLDDGYTDGILSVKIEPSDGLSVFGGSSAKTFNMAAPGPHIWDVDVKADVDGVYFLNVFSEAQGQPRSFSVRVNMGQVTQKMFDAAMPADGELVEGGKIRVMDAEETIR